MSLEAHHKIHENVQNIDRFNLIHSKKSVMILDRWVMVVGILAPLTAIPQIYTIVSTQSSKEVSLSTWLLFIVIATFWLLYGIAHEEKAIIVNNSLWIMMEFIIVGLILIYR